MIARLIVFLAILSLSLPLQGCAAPPQSTDLLEGTALEHFQPSTHWHRVERAVAVPDRMELTSSGDLGKGSVLVNSLIKDISVPYLLTRESFGDVEVELEFMIPKGSNAGIYLMGRYEVQILDSSGKEKVGSGDMGGIYAYRDTSKPKDKQWSGGSRPLVNASLAPGQWQNMKIVFQAPRFDARGQKTSDALFKSVFINGKQVQKNTPTKGPTASHPLPGECAAGPIAIQGDHGPIAIRKFTVMPLPSPGSTVLSEIDAYWAEVSRAVRDGDFEAYAATTHPHGIIISGSKQTSYPLSIALARWKSDFEKTRSGQVTSTVEFRFSHRYRDTDTSHESGIFRYTSQPQNGEPVTDYIDFEALLTRQDGRWQMLMEYQKGPASREQWDALPP